MIRVLHVDDDPGVLELLQLRIQREFDHVRVVSETSPEDALQTIAQEPVHCVVSDYEMESTDGLEFLAEVRELDPTMPFILFTVHERRTVARQALAAGATDYVQKELLSDTFHLLVNRIDNAVARRRAERRTSLLSQRLESFADTTHESTAAVDDDRRINQ